MSKLYPMMFEYASFTPRPPAPVARPKRKRRPKPRVVKKPRRAKRRET